MKNWFVPAKDWIFAHKKTAAVGVCVLAALLITVGAVSHRNGGAPQAVDHEATAGQAGEIDAWGEVNYSRMEDISIDFPSMVTEVLVKEGDKVTLGQPLVTLDCSEYNGAIEKLKQQLNANQAALPTAKQDISAMQADITQTQSQMAREKKEYDNGTSAELKLLQNSLTLAQKELDTAKSDLQNYQSLYNAGAASKATLSKYEDALNQRQKGINDVQTNIQKTKTALKDELNKLNVSLKSKQVQLAQLKLTNTANVAKQQGSLSSAQVDLNAMTAKSAKSYIKNNQIASDISNGIVKSIAVSDETHLGVQGAPTKVIQIIDADSLTISAEVNEEFISSVKIGETVKIVPTSTPDSTLSGTVTQIPKLAVEKDGKRIIRVLVKSNDPHGLLKPGYTADVYFTK